MCVCPRLRRRQAQLQVSKAEGALASYLQRQRATVFKSQPGTDAVKIVKFGTAGKRVLEVQDVSATSPVEATGESQSYGGCRHCQVQVPVPLANRATLPPEYTIASQTASVRRYTTVELTHLARCLSNATAALREAESSAVDRLVKRFLAVGASVLFRARCTPKVSVYLWGVALRVQYCDMWRQLGDSVSLLDALLSLRMFASVEGSRGPLCLPMLLSDDGDYMFFC